MKRALMIVFVLMLLVSAFAEQPQLDYNMFYAGKEAVACISMGDYESASSILGCGKKELKSFVEGNYYDVSNAQMWVSVAYMTGNMWYIAIPVNEPTDGNVEVFVFTSNDGVTFSGLQYATWADTEMAYSACDYVLWCEEYMPVDGMFIE